MFHDRKRTKKTAVRSGRKKAKKDNTPPEQGTPRTRAALAKEAGRQAEEAAAVVEAAAAKAIAAAQEATVAERDLLDVPPLETQEPSSPRTPPR